MEAAAMNLPGLIGFLFILFLVALVFWHFKEPDKPRSSRRRRYIEDFDDD